MKQVARWWQLPVWAIARCMSSSEYLVQGAWHVMRVETTQQIRPPDFLITALLRELYGGSMMHQPPKGTARLRQ